MKKSEEPEAKLYIQEIGDPKEFDEIVFCGYGEPQLDGKLLNKLQNM
jgi:TatD DNase family protein